MGAKLFVGNLSLTTTEDDLRVVFGEGGREIKDVHVLTERATGVSRGFAFVELANETSALQAKESLQGRSVQGKVITVNVAKERAPGSELNRR
jgi:RNA recognition motif-containing protein